MSTIKEILYFVIKEKAQGNAFHELNVQMKIMMKGINVKGILEERIPDTPDLRNKLSKIATEFDVDLKKMMIG